MFLRILNRKCQLILFVLLVAAVGAAQADIQDWEATVSAANPIHWYKFEEATGTDCFDYGSEGLYGTYDGVFLGQEGLFGAGTAVRFDRSAANIVDFAGSTDISSPWTVEYIVKKMSEAVACDAQALHDSDFYGIRLAGWTAEADAGFVEYFVADYQFTPVAGLAQEDLVVPQNTWMHVTFRADGTGMQLFFNGALVGTSMNSVPFPRERIGARDTGSNKLDAFLDEAVVYDYALADVNILAHAVAAGLGGNVVVPTPLSVGIDDVGWKRGWSTGATGGPFRISMPEGRWMVWDDYEVLVYVAEAVKTRLQCLFVMCEFDRSNICAEYPTTTQEGSSWDNSALVSDDDFTIMNYVKDKAAYIEFGLHGVGHEYWEEGVRTRAEFADESSPWFWPWSDVWGHMECFERLINQYGISFPKSFVPPAHCYYYDPLDLGDTGGLMQAWGVKYAEHPETYITDNGLMVLTRMMSVHYADISMVPSTIVSDYYYEWGHWTNFVETDPVNNHIAGDKWIAWFNQIKDLPNRYLPKNTAQLFSQYLYQHYSSIDIDENAVEVDNTQMPDWAYNLDLLGNLLLKLLLEPGTHVSSASLNGDNIACYYEDRGFAYIVLPKLDKSSYTLIYQTGTSEMANYVLNEGTYNVERFETSADSATVLLEMYGTQDVKVKLHIFEPVEVQSDTVSLIINSSEWDGATNTLVMNITATDDQGVEGEITIIGEPVCDLNGDGCVDFVDFAILTSQCFQAPGSPSADIAPVPGGDGIVDKLDIAVFAEHWLGCS